MLCPFKKETIYNTTLGGTITSTEENFMEWLTNCRKDKKLKEREWRMCLLVKMCFLPVEMAVLLVTSKQNVSNMRSRLVQKIFGQNGRSGEFDILISEL